MASLLRLRQAVSLTQITNNTLIQEQKLALDILTQVLESNAIVHRYLFDKKEETFNRLSAAISILNTFIALEKRAASAPVRAYLIDELQYKVTAYASLLTERKAEWLDTNPVWYINQFDEKSGEILQVVKEITDTIRYDFYVNNVYVQNIIKKIYLHMFILVIILVLVCIFLALRISYAVTIPIHTVAQAAREIACGKFGENLKIHGHDELSELIHAFNSMSNQLKIAIETLEQKVQERTQELQEKIKELNEAWKTSDSLREIGQLIASTLDLDEVLERILESLRTVLTYDTASIILKENNKFVIKAVRGFEKPEIIIGSVFDIKDLPLTDEIIRTGLPIIISDTSDDVRWQQIPGTEKIKSWLGVPLFAGKEINGMLAVDSFKLYNFNESNIPLVKTFASQASVALQNAHLYNDVCKHIHRLTVLNEISSVISSELDKHKLMRSLCEELKKIMKIDTFHGSVYHSASNVLSFLIWYDNGEYHSFGSGPLEKYYWSSKVINSREPLIVLRTEAEVLEENEKRKKEKVYIRPSASMLFAPLIYGDSVLGALSVQSYDYNAYTQEDLDFLANTARQAAIALRNAELFEGIQNALKTATEANKLKSQFLANISHELRTPLNAIINFAYLLSMETECLLQENQFDMIKRIEDSGRHLLGLINDVLDLAKIESGKFEMNFEILQLSDIIIDAVTVSNSLVRDKPVEMSASIPYELPLVVADKVRIRQVLLNLLSNAAKFTNSGSIVVRAMPSADYTSVFISVQDTGIGIAQNDIPKIFEEFVQLDGTLARKNGGTGLGLPISRHFIEMHGGTLEVESEPGKGSVFRFFLHSFIGPREE